MSNKSMIISLIGRPNVGKSSIFNLLIDGKRKALTHDTPGVTRDRHYAISKFANASGEEEKDAIMVDTGGFYPNDIDESEFERNHFFNIMREHAKLSINESDLVLFVVDVREGLLPMDKEIVKILRSSSKNFWLIINKYDTDKQAGTEADFFSLGLKEEEMFVVSAAHSRGIHDLKESLYKELVNFDMRNPSDQFLQKGVTPREQVAGRLAIIGAPNAGKSTLLNNLLGAKRALVSSVAGTTVDPIEGYFDLYFGPDAKRLEEEDSYQSDEYFFNQYEKFRENNPTVFARMQRDEEETYILGAQDDEEEWGSEENVDDELRNDELVAQAFSEAESAENTEDFEETKEAATEADEGSWWRSLHLVDTAGIRKRKNISEFIEEQSVYRSLRCITESDIVLYLVDATIGGISHQDRRLIDIAIEKGKSVIVLLNKMDLLKDQFETDKERREWILDRRDELPWLKYCDIIPVSAKNGKGVKAIKQAIKRTILVRKTKLPTSELNKILLDLVEKNPVMLKKSRGRSFRVKYASMIKNNPPTILMFTNKSKSIPENYRRYLKNGLRNFFSLPNTPIHLIFRTSNDLERRMKKVKLPTN